MPVSVVAQPQNEQCVSSTVVWPEDRSRRTCGDLVHATLDERETKVQRLPVPYYPPSGAAVCGMSIAAVCGISIAAVIGVPVT